MKSWHPNYQPRDWNLIDYHEFHLKGCDVPFRGPGFDPMAAAPGSYFTCLGAAQTYGCFYERPFPTLVSESLGLPVLNLAVGGSGPGFYDEDVMVETINRGRFTILQCMAARAESNALYEADGYVEFVRDRKTGETVTSSDAWHRIVGEGLDFAVQRLEESRQSWVETSLRLLARIKVPVVFFWYSRRTPDYKIDEEAIRVQLAKRAAGEKTSFFVDGLVGDFPQLIDGKTMRAVADRCDAYAECLSSRGMNQPLFNRFTGEPFAPVQEVDKNVSSSNRPEMGIDYSKNAYYPSAEMHEDAAAALLPVIRRLLETDAKRA